MPQIVHLGVGNFHRAHQAWYTELANRQSREHWQIIGVSLRSATVRDQLAPQNCDYTLAISSQAGTQYEQITSIDRVYVAGPDTPQILDAIAAPETQIVTLTVTEKAYHLSADTGQLYTAALDVQADINGATKTIYGLIAQGLQRRMSRKAAPITVLCCDNLAANGDTLAAAMHVFAAQFDPSLAEYLNTNVTFPNCMVDRITPATTDELRDTVLRETGRPDRAPVATEAFSDWVIEDRFAADRPGWDQVGARFVIDVAPFELRKLRMLNGAHSCLAYAGTQRGYDFVHQAIADQHLASLARQIMTEAAQTLPDDIKDSAPAYAEALMDRFSNPALHHKLRQIAMDGSQKTPIRLIAPWMHRHAHGLPSPAIEAAIAAWVQFVKTETAQGRVLNDPLGGLLAALCQTVAAPNALLSLIGAPPELVAAFADQ